MSYLLYCILHGRRGGARPTLRGVGEQTVSVLDCGALCAAISGAAAPRTEDSAAGAQLDDLLAYARVVEAFNRYETVVPMRYGCCFARPAQARTWMLANAAHLSALLRRLEGCVEMGIRALLMATVPPPAPAARKAASGAAYLAARKADLSLAQHGERVAHTIRDVMADSYRECFAQLEHSAKSPMLSMYFLVERGRLGHFRETYARIATGGAALMLSGPWPPYNFVCGPTEAESVLIRPSI